MATEMPPDTALRPAGTPLRSLDDAVAELLAQAQPLGPAESVSTFDSDGRVLARDLVSELSVPARDNSAMDGYAVRCADAPVVGAVLRVTQRIAAGSTGRPIGPGEAARIFTGAPIPAGADAVVMQEQCERTGDDQVLLQRVPLPGQWIRRAGEDVELGSLVLAAGTRLTPASLGLAASIGYARLSVGRRPRVALFSTGDELVMPGTVAPANLPPGSIFNSNRYFLRSLLQRLGCEVTDMGVVPDRLQATLEALQTAAAAHDLILTSGGVSVGEEDHVKPAVSQLGELSLWQIAIKPGKPFAYGRVGAAQFIGLPGNPVSSFVTFVLLVRPFLLRLQGATQLTVPSLSMKAGFRWDRPDSRREFLRARYRADGALELFANQSSGVLTSTVWGDGLVDNPPRRSIAPGDEVRFIPFASLLG